MNEEVRYKLIGNVKEDTIKHIFFNKGTGVDVKMLKHIFIKSVECFIRLCNKFANVYEELLKSKSKLNHIMKETTSNSTDLVNVCMVDADIFFNKVERETFMKEDLSAFNKIINELSSVYVDLLQTVQQTQNILTIFHIYLFHFQSNAEIFYEWLFDYQEKNKEVYEKGPFTIYPEKSQMCCSCLSECPFLTLDSEVQNITKHYKNSDINKIMKMKLSVSCDTNNHTHIILLFHLLLCISYWMTKDLTEKSKVLSIIRTQIQSNVDTLKNLTVYFSYNPYINKIKKLNEKFLYI